MLREIYLDNSSTTRPFDEVIQYMDEIYSKTYGNPSSLHRRGIEAERVVKNARETIADSLGAESREIYFTSGGTEANNLAIRGFLSANPRSGKHIITTKIEHPSVLEVFKYLEKQGYKTDYLDVDSSGCIDIEELRERINKDTALISIIHTNNETGTIQPIDEVVKIKNQKNKKTALHVDAVQAYGKSKLSPRKNGVDMLSVSAHKIHGPKGAGALYVNRNIRISPIIFGGGQESLIRSGTENVAGIGGFGKASEIFLREINNKLPVVEEINKQFIKMLKENFEGIRINSPYNASPFILNVSFKGLKAEVLLHHLEERNIFVSTGSACSSRRNTHSHVLEAMGCMHEYLEGAIRFSFSIYNKKEDIYEVIKQLKEIVPRIQIKPGGRI
jgi:cysteine desulfurase